MSTQVEVSVKRINRLNGDGTLKAFCDVTVAELFLIKGVRVVEGKKGLFVSMPQERGKDGNWYDTVIPLTKEARQQVSETVLSAYQSDEIPV
ncbi:MAG: septation protein SpoVG family protein [Candidatus Omnitrophica bacterium]|nr:septation protein SpoVG family protein [Candidatus Omnitrophota bacterium]